jgi:hypothetical protein
VSVVTLMSVRSCAVTTTATALAATWPNERRLLAELDPAGGTLAAAAGWSPDRGLVSLATAVRRTTDPAAIWDHCQPLGDETPVLAGPATPDLARSTLGMVDPFLAGLGDLDGDVLADLGRANPAAPSPAVARRADLVLVVARPRLPDLQALSAWLEGPGADVGPLGLVLVGPGPYRADEVAEALAVEAIAEIPWDPPAAEALATTSVRTRHLARSPLVRAARTAAEQVAIRLAEGRVGDATRPRVPVVTTTGLVHVREVTR